MTQTAPLSVREFLGKKPRHHAFIFVPGDDGQCARVRAAVEELWGFSFTGNPDFFLLSGDVFGIDESRRMREEASRAPAGERKIFFLRHRSFTGEAQNALLKTLEDPSPRTHFFLFAPSENIFLSTLLSRTLLFREGEGGDDESVRKDAADFLAAPPARRLEIAKRLSDGKDITRALAFLDACEEIFFSGREIGADDIDPARAFFEARAFLRGRSPSVKMIFEHLSLTLPPFPRHGGNT